jgi:GTP-binding protein HflX
MLFATLDPTLREIRLPGGRPAILSDTVGFISDLPHELVEAFRATLEEVQEADIVLHVRDIATPDSEAERRDVEEVLDQLKAGRDSGRTIIEVWNKIDLLDAEDRGATLSRALRTDGGAIALSAVTGEGTDRLLDLLGGLVDEGPPLRVQLGAQDGEALAWLYRNGRIVERTDSEEGVELGVRLDRQAVGRFERRWPGALQ